MSESEKLLRAAYMANAFPKGKVIFAKQATPGVIYRDANPKVLFPKPLKCIAVREYDAVLAVYVDGYGWCSFPASRGHVLRVMSKIERKAVGLWAGRLP